MSGAHEKLEQAEHAAHSGGHHGGNSKLFGVTMALIGVLIAFCAAKVGSERNELTRSLVEQTQAHSDYDAASTKYRLVMLELEKQRARILTVRDAPGGESPVKRMIELYGDYSTERKLTKAFADSYDPLVDAHFWAAEGYERAQFLAEIAIVLASLGVLLSSRPAWMLSVLLALGCVAQVGLTYFPKRHTFEQGLTGVRAAEEAYKEMRKAHTGAHQDEKLIERLDPDGRIRAALQTQAKAEQGSQPETAGTEAKK